MTTAARNTAADPALERDLLITEYASLKDEQRSRIGTRDNLLYTTIAAYAGVLTVTVSGHRAAYLLLAAPVALILGWTYAANDTMITAIGRYLAADLGPRAAALTGTAQPFGWETGHFRRRLRVSRKAGQLACDLLTFIVPPTASAFWYWLTAPADVLLLAASAAETAAVLTLAAWIVWNSGLTRRAA